MAKKGFNIQAIASAMVRDSNEKMAEVADKFGTKVLEKTDPKVPKDTGALAASGRKTVFAKGSGDNAEINLAVTYGGKTRLGEGTPSRKGTGRTSPEIVDYAAAVHELQTPYLLNGMQEAEGELAETFRREIKSVLQRRR